MVLILPNDEIINVYKDVRPLSLEEFNKLSNKEKEELYIELSPKDKYIVRLTDNLMTIINENSNTIKEQI